MGLNHFQRATFFWNGQPSSKYIAYLQEPPKFTIPKKRLDIVSVPGRNGDVIFDLDSYDNVSVEYDVVIGDEQHNLETCIDKFVGWMHSVSGYGCLADHYSGLNITQNRPQYFRYAALDSELNIENIVREAGKLSLKFNCKPFKYDWRYSDADLDSAIKKAILIKANGTDINNIYAFSAKPVIIVKGDIGSELTLTIGSSKYKLLVKTADPIFIDSPLDDVYSMSSLGVIENQNGNLFVLSGPDSLPLLAKSITTPVSYEVVTGAISEVKVIPNLCTL